MIVYMLLNTVTEKVYVGATKYSLNERLNEHLKSARQRSNASIHQALRDWPQEFWFNVVLCCCYSEKELSDAERAWQIICNVFDPAIGYNDSTIPYIASRRRDPMPKDKRRDVSGEVLTMTVKSTSPLAGLTAEQRREYFREAGRRGAAKSKAKGR